MLLFSQLSQPGVLVCIILVIFFFWTFMYFDFFDHGRWKMGCDINIYYLDMSVFTGEIFSISSLVKLSLTSFLCFSSSLFYFRNTHICVIKRKLHVGLKIWSLSSHGKNKLHMFAPPCNILYIMEHLHSWECYCSFHLSHLNKLKWKRFSYSTCPFLPKCWGKLLF